jgi:predicted dehydrogenase
VAKQFFADVAAPITVSIRFNSGPIPADHWTQNESIGGGRLIGEACHGIDLATHLVGSVPVRVYAESVGGPNAGTIRDDQCFITVRHANGAISSIAYLAGGDKSFPKERIELIGGGKIAVIDDFRHITTCAAGRTKHQKLGHQDKGHSAEIEAFAASLRTGAAPIPWEELRAVSLASLLVVQSLREGTPFDVE